MYFISIQKKEYPLTLTSFFFFKYLQFKPLTLKSLRHKTYQRYVFSLDSLHKIHWRHFLGLFHQFFLCVEILYTNAVFHAIYYGRNGFSLLPTNLFSKSGVALTIYIDLFLYCNEKGHTLVGFDTLIHLSHLK